MPKLLAIEAATDGCSVALSLGDQQTITRFEEAPRMHSRVMYPMLDSIMAEAGIRPIDLDAVVFGKGPGSFTGLRIAAATAQGIGFGADIPLIGVSTLQSIAQRAKTTQETQQVLTILDARMNELYYGAYEWDQNKQLMIPMCEDFIGPLTLETLPVDLASEHCIGAGNGWALTDQLGDQLKSYVKTSFPEVLPQAEYLLPDAQVQWAQGDKLLQPEEVELVYLREQSHWKTIKEQKELK